MPKAKKRQFSINRKAVIIGIITFVLMVITALLFVRNSASDVKTFAKEDVYYIVAANRDTPYDLLEAERFLEQILGTNPLCMNLNHIHAVSKNDHSIVKSVDLNTCYPARLAAAIDKKQRIWIGGGGIRDNRKVLVYSPFLGQIKTLDVCLNPTAGIWFYENDVYVVCSDTGFRSEVVVVDINSFDIKTRWFILPGDNVVDLTKTPSIEKEDNFLATSSLLYKDALYVASYTKIQVYDVKTKQHIKTISLLPFIRFDNLPLKISNMVPSDGKVILSNSADWRTATIEDRELVKRNNLVVPENNSYILIDPDKKYHVSYIRGTPATSLTRTFGTNLISYHYSPIHTSSLNQNTKISITNNKSFEQKVFSINYNLGVQDMAVINNEIVLGINDLSEKQEHGIYRFDSKTGEVQRKNNIKNVTQILVP